MAMGDRISEPPTSTCPNCAGPLSKNMIGSAVGGTTSAFYGFNHAMPIVRRWVKGPMWLHFLIGAPPVIVLSSAFAGLAGGALPAMAQLVSSSCHSATSSSSLLAHSAKKTENLHKTRSSSLLSEQFVQDNRCH